MIQVRLEKARRLYKTANQDQKYVLESLFPELKMTEDEQFRKRILEELYDGLRKFDGELKRQFEFAIAWLEGQGENSVVNFDEAEKEKDDFVSGKFIVCRRAFNVFKEDDSYWFEYVGDDNYIGRSDNILNQKFHITPRQLFTFFTQQHNPKEDSNVNHKTNTPMEYGNE